MESKFAQVEVAGYWREILSQVLQLVSFEEFPNTICELFDTYFLQFNFLQITHKMVICGRDFLIPANNLLIFRNL